jgi:hypothetical protein
LRGGAAAAAIQNGSHRAAAGSLDCFAALAMPVAGAWYGRVALGLEAEIATL